MSQPRIIVFVGTVGSGKSTHIRLLHSKLRGRGLKVRMCFLKTGHLFACVLEVFLVRVVASNRRSIFPIRALVEERPPLFKRLFRLWLGLDLISITMKFLMEIYFPMRLGYTVLVEEYVPATISDYIYIAEIIGFPFKANSFVVNYLLKLTNLCNRTQIVFLDADNSNLAYRWKLRGSFHERDDYLLMQRTTLLQISKKLANRFLYVDTGTKTIGETHKLIMDQLIL